MCDDQSPDIRPWDADEPTGHNSLRRRLVLAALAIPVVGRIGVLTQSQAVAQGEPSVVSWRSDRAVKTAMHLHGSHSEGPASIGAHLAELNRTNYRAAFITDHDWRQRAFGAQQLVSLTSLAGEDYGPGGINGAWVWTEERDGDVGSAGVTVVGEDSPDDPDAAAGFQLSVTGSSPAPATIRLLANTNATRNANRVNLTGQTIRVAVNPRSTGKGWLELGLELSYHPATGGRQAGQYLLTYRFGLPAGHTADGRSGLVDIPLPTDVWTTVSLYPVADIGQIWPDLVAEDNALVSLWLGATSLGEVTTTGTFGYLAFDFDQHDGHKPNEVRRQIIAAYAARNPGGTRMYVGEEISQGGLHMIQYGDDLVIPAYPAGLEEIARQRAKPDDMVQIITNQVHPAGNLASLSHVYGTSEGSVDPPDRLRQRTEELAVSLIDARLYEADIVEFGYRKRGNADLAEHLHLMNIIIRNGFVMTANGVSDDHGAREGSIHRINNPMATVIWAQPGQSGPPGQPDDGPDRAYYPRSYPTRPRGAVVDVGMNDLLDALRQGRCLVTDIGRFSGLVDLQFADFRPGAVVEDIDGRLVTAQLTVHGTELRSNGYVEIVRVPVDQVSTSSPPQLDPQATLVTTIQNDTLNAGPVQVRFDTSSSAAVYARFFTVQGEDDPESANIELVGFTNPIWYLRHEFPLAARPLTAGRQISRV